MSDSPDQSASENKGEMLSIKVSMPQDENLETEEIPDARIAYDDTNLSLTWENGDQLRLVGLDAGGNIKGTTDFKLTGKTGGRHTIFMGQSVPGATHYDIYYLCNDKFPVSKDGKTNMLYSDQHQLADNSTQHLKHALFMKSNERVPAEYLKLETQNIPLSMQNSIMRFDLSNIPDNIKTINNLTWKVVNPRGNGSKEISLSFNDLDIIGKKLTGFMCFTDMNIKKNGNINITLKDSDPSNSENQICTYKLKINNDITFKSNNRYIATIDLKNETQSSSNRFYYKSNIELFPNMFDDDYRPTEGSYDKSTEIGFLDFPINSDDEEIELEEKALKGNKVITYLEFEGGIEEIGESAFEGCTNLERVKFPKSMKEIEEHAFKGCTNLKEVIIPGVQEINKGAFEGCTSLEKITLPSKLEEIELDVFKGCKSLKEIRIHAVTPPEVSSKYPFKVSDEQIKNPLGFNTSIPGFKIYVPSSGMNRYKDEIEVNNVNINPWYVYRDFYNTLK